MQQGGEIVASETYQKGDPDFSAQLTRIRASEPDVIFIPGYYTDVGNIAIQARKLGIKVPLLGGDGWDSEKLGEIAGDCDQWLFLLESLRTRRSGSARAGVHQEIQRASS